ncbi:MAG: HlyD family efflux transporter periplasmic adaptor subunit [Bacteroidales bacterium]|nr:HlyD family efflux transporter periplasmic adaptor subunit [Bacteroidales bacterium]
MDRKIEPTKGIRKIFTKKAIPFWGAAILIVFISWLIFRDDASKLRISNDILTVSEVKKGEFNDYIRVNGRVVPMTSVQLSPLEGGIVQQIVMEEGSRVHEGDVILILSNESLDMQILNAEADLAEKENILRNTMIQMEQQKLTLQQEKLQLQMEVRRKQRTYESQKALYDDNLIAREAFLQAEEEYQLSCDRLKLVENRAKQDSLYRSVEIRQMRESLENMRLNMQMIRKRKDNLTIKAPIDGELGLVDVELGQSVAMGSKVGQINNQDNYKIEALIDEHYIDRVTAGLEAVFERQGGNCNVVIRKVYPEVRDGKFKADFKFPSGQPANIRNGQTFYLNLQLGQPEDAVMIPRGAFYQHTGGKWIYVMSPDGKQAVKREIRIGRQNPQYYEVLEGLEPGEKVITSSYDRFGENEVLVID